ncbi:hypothetical protein JL721_10658 [Aureococcus anophagefferens]|nr:hypothetical protein JL721_10658 [Aureococcus anophagefferens]
MGKKKGQTERTRVSAHEDRLKLNGVAWAAKLGIPTDEEFWAKWATLDDATVMVEPPVKDRSRCAYGCKRKVYFLESNARTHSQNCDGVCDRRAQKIIANFGFSREHNTGTTDGVLKRARRGAAGGGKRGAGGSKTGIDDARSAPESRGFGARDKPTHCPKAAPTEKLPYFRRCRGRRGGLRLREAAPARERLLQRAVPAPRRGRRRRRGAARALRPSAAGVGADEAPPRRPSGATWAAAPRPVAPRPPPPPAAPRMQPEGAIRPSSATATASSTPTTKIGATSSSSGRRRSPVREDDDDDLAWALELSRASEPGSFDAGGADVWERVVDAQSGAPYWWNRDTDETTWDDPAAGRDGGGLSAALDGSAAAPFDTLEGMLRAVGLSDLAPALAAEEVDLETLKFLCLDDPGLAGLA